MGTVYRKARRIVAIALPACFALAAHASTFVVGTPVTAGQCTHATVQAALDAAAANAGPDIVRITRTQNWTAQELHVDSDDDIDILGGFADCTSAAPDGTQTTLDGSGGNPRPVFAIRSDGFVRLRDLTITGGDQDGDDNGGGIYFEGAGELNIADSTIVNNVAYDGGGIYAVGTTFEAELALGENVSVGFNTARKSGGGVVAKSIEMTLEGPNSTIWFNTAEGSGGGGNGGGLAVVSDALPAYAYIKSNGIGDIGALYGNQAVNGGGAAVLGGDDSGQDAVLYVYSTDSAQAVVINGNTASNHGGGIYLRPHRGFSDIADASAETQNANILENSAADGGAVYADFNGDTLPGVYRGSNFHFNAVVQQSLPGIAPCPFARPCGIIAANTADDDGAVIRSTASTLRIARAVLRDNAAGRLIYSTYNGDYSDVNIGNSLIVHNMLAHELVRQAGDHTSTTFDHVTIADNDVGTAYLMSIEMFFDFTRSIVAQPGLPTLAATAQDQTIEYVISNDVTNLLGATIVAPRFVDPARGDYSPQAGSVAVDFAVSMPDDPADLYSHTRNVDIPAVPNEDGVGDAGAIEREYVQPLVLNANFDADLSLWDAAGSSMWDATQNAAGAPGSGSLMGMLAVDDGSVVVRSQCVHLPGPGAYALDGWGRVSHASPIHNQALLKWELRRDGGVFGCSDGAPNASGSLLLANDSAWNRPSAPAIIDVPDAAFTSNTSLTIYAVAVNGNPIARAPAGTDHPSGGPDAWFDGITLDIALDDTIFADGFDMN